MWEGIRYIAALISPRGAPHFVRFVGILSLHRGYAFIFLAPWRIYNPFLCSMSVISRYHDALMRLAVCAIRRAFAFPLWTTLAGHLLNTRSSLTAHSVKQQSSNGQATLTGHLLNNQRTTHRPHTGHSMYLLGCYYGRQSDLLWTTRQGHTHTQDTYIYR